MKPTHSQILLVEWLQSLKQERVSPINVTLTLAPTKRGKVKSWSYQGASYYSPTDRDKRRLYLLGEIPFKNMSCVGLDGEWWFVAGYWDPFIHARPQDRLKLLTEYAKHHPLGLNFLLFKYPPGYNPQADPPIRGEAKPVLLSINV